LLNFSKHIFDDTINVEETVTLF